MRVQVKESNQMNVRCSVKNKRKLKQTSQKKWFYRSTETNFGKSSDGKTKEKTA